MKSKSLKRQTTSTITEEEKEVLENENKKRKLENSSFDVVNLKISFLNSQFFRALHHLKKKLLNRPLKKKYKNTLLFSYIFFLCLIVRLIFVIMFLGKKII